MALRVNDLLQERYRIQKVLGHGGMSSVYMAFDENVHIPVAIKENLVLSENYSTQFKKEATILATLRHPNLPRVSDYFYIPGQGQYLVMDYIDGEDLRERIERIQQLPEKEVIVIGILICDALMYLHSLEPKVIHRDIKPGNIRITPEGNIILVDFGLVKVIEIDQHTATGAKAMTPGYSPPEQYGRGTTDERSDIYSLGATLYAALTGMIPEESINRLAGKEKLTPIRKYRAGISQNLEKAIMKALEIDPEKRFQKSEDFYLALVEAGNFQIIPKNISLVSAPPNQKISTSIKTGMSQPLLKAYDDVIPINNKNTNKRLFTYITFLIILFFTIGFWRFDFLKGLFVDRELNSSSNNVSAPVSTKTISVSSVSTLENLKEESVTPSPPVSATENANILPTIGGGSGEIIFASNFEDNVMQLWLMKIDTLQKQKITQLSDGACQPDWSPDGKKVVFISPCNSKKDTYEGARLYLLDTTLNNQIVPLDIPIDPAGDFDPVWSPDGNKVAFSSYRPGNNPITKERMIHLYVFNLSDNSLMEITNSRWRDRHPTWSTDGIKIAFSRKIANNEIWILDLTSSDVSKFASRGSSNLLYPDWSSNDEYLFFTSQNTASGSLPYFLGKKVDENGENLEFRIPPSGQTSFSPSVDSVVSPDGEWFLFESWPDGVDHNIFIATINGANLTQLTFDSSFEFSPDWKP